MARGQGERTRAGTRLARAHLGILAAFALATLVVLSAVLPDPAHRIFRGDSGENFADFWNLRWVREALSLPFFAILDPVAVAVLAHNLWVAMSFVLCGYATFFFARRLSGSTSGSALAGLLVAFSPFRIHHLDHLSLLSNFWIPLAALAVGPWIFATGTGGPPARSGKPGLGLVALAACGAGLAGTSFTNLAVTATLLGVWLAWTAMLDRARIRKGWPWRIPAAGAAVTLGALPFLGGRLMWLVKSAWQIFSPERITSSSLDPLGFVTPPRGALLGKVPALWVGGHQGVGGDELFLGFVFTGLAVLGARRLGHRGLALLLTAATGLVLALEVSSLFVPMILIGLAPLAAAGFARARGRWGRLAALLVPLALAESLVIPRGHDAVRTESLYAEMRDDPTPGAVLEIALGRENPNLYAFHQIVHRRPLVSGHLQRVSGAASELEARLNLRERLTRGETAGAAVEDLRGLGVAFLVLHRAGVATEVWQPATAVVEKHAEVWSRSRERVVYRLRREGPAPDREPEAEP